MNYEVAYMYVAAILKAKPEGIVSISPEATVAQAAEMLPARRIGFDRRHRQRRRPGRRHQHARLSVVK